MTRSDLIRVGIGGWSYEPWRTTFYPPEVAKKNELEYASRQVTAIEINSTFYRLQKPSVFAKWRDATPEDFMFSVKAPRFIVQRKVLAEAGDSVVRFLDSGVCELGAKLGPLLWQFTPWQRFDAADLGSFLELLPKQANGVTLQHALEVRHKSFMSSEYLALARGHGVATVFTDDDSYPSFADLTADFVYARLRRSVSSEETGYSTTVLKEWAQRARTWTQGEEPTDLPRIESAHDKSAPRQVFIYFINGAKERAPAAAKQLIEELS
jgi:uncharacterized protein YecE (DUF72 family)